jgi:hypothetical protein
MEERVNAELMGRNHGISPLDAARTLAYTAVAAGPVQIGKATLDFTVGTTANIKKGMCVYIAAGAYAGIWPIAKIVSATVVRIYCTVAFGATTTGSLVFSAHLSGIGFYVESAPTIAELTARNSNQDTVGFMAQTFTVGAFYEFAFTRIRITAGKITVVRAPEPAQLSYTNR